MTYLTALEFETRAGTQETIELTNLDDPSAVNINLARLELAISDSCGEINGYLASRYCTPLNAASVPGFLKAYCFDIARYRLAENNLPEEFQRRYDNAISRLKDIEKGTMILVDDSGNPVPNRKESTPLIDERGNVLDDWSAIYEPGGCPSFNNLNLL